MKNIENKIEKYKTIEKKYMYLVKILQELNYEDKLIVLNCLIKNSAMKRDRLIEIKHQYELHLNTNKVFKYSKEIDILDKSINLYDDFIKTIKIENSLKDKIIRPNLNITDSKIKEIDNIIGKNTFSLFYKLKYAFKIENRLEILYKLKDVYSNCYVKMNKEEFGKNYKTFKKIYNYICETIKIENEIKNNLNKNNKNYKTEYYYPTLNLSDDKIELIDSFTNENTLSLFKKLEIENNVNKRIEVLDLLKDKYLKIRLICSKDDMGEIYKYIKEINRFINDAIRIEHKKKKASSKKFAPSQECEEQLDLKYNEIIRCIELNNRLEYYDLVSILKSYKYLIVHDLKKYSINVLKVSKYISNEIVNNEIKDDAVIVLINSIKDTIKYRLLYLDKENSEDQFERSILKELRIVFDFICKNYKEDSLSTKHDYKYDVIKYFLNDESGYPYLKKIVNDMPSMVNIRVSEFDNEHIIINILKEYLKNYKLMLKNKKGNYINPDYLKQVYLLFKDSENLKLTIDDKKYIDELLDNFLIYLDEFIYKDDRKTLAKKEIRKLKTEYLYREKNARLKRINENQLNWQIYSLSDNRQASLKDDSRVMLKDNCITLNGINAYSYFQDDNKKVLKVHVIDTSKIIVPHTTVDSDIYNSMINKEKIDISIRNQLLLDYNNINPTITYEMEFDKYNNILNFRIYKSKIKVSYKNEKLFYELKSFLKKVLSLRNICNYDTYGIDKSAEILLNGEFMKYVDENKMPFMYSGKEIINNYVNHMNNLNNIFNRLESQDFKKLYNIISENIGEYNYSTKKFDVEGEYNLNLINNINYLFIFNQRMLNDIIFNGESLKNKENYKKEYEKLEIQFNLSNKHIRPDDIIFENSTKRNKLKQFNL